MKNALLKEKLQEMNFIMSDLLVMIEKDDISHEAIRENPTSLPEAWARNQKNLENRIASGVLVPANKEDEKMEGTIIKRADGAYEVRVMVNGKQQYIGRAKTVLEARKLRSIAVSSKKKGKLKTKSKMLYDWIDEWIEKYKQNQVRPSTLSEIKSVVKNHIRTHFTNKAIDKITLDEVQTGLLQISSSKMRETTKAYLHEIFKRAQQNGLIKFNPVEAAVIPKHIESEGRALSPQEEQIFFEKIKSSPNYGPFLFMRWTGSRPVGAEIVEWKDIDFQNKSVFVDDKKTKIKRAVPLVAELGDYLVRITQTPGKIFPNFRARNCSRTTKNLNLGFDITPKDLRTTFGTQCADNGVPIEILSRWMGHTTTKTTEKYYIKKLSTLSKNNAHLIDSHKKTH